MKGSELSDKLWNLYSNYHFSDNDSLLQVNEQVEGTAFFPCGSGLYENSNETIDILVLGQDFGTVHYYKEALSVKDKDLNSPTWKNLISLFNNAGINMSQCFFSNVYMGVRIKNNMVGKAVPKRKCNLSFIKDNMEFLREQIKTVNPKAIITLGNYATSMLINSCDSGLTNWSRSGKVSDITENDVAVFGDLKIPCVALLHPSMRYANLHKRNAKLSSNDNDGDIEIKLLKEIV